MVEGVKFGRNKEWCTADGGRRVECNACMAEDREDVGAKPSRRGGAGAVDISWK